jgi:hypothetical protein
MNPTTPEQLARLLDQISASYPNGIPLSVIRAAEGAHEDAAPAPRPYHIFIAGGEGTLCQAARELLSGITTKGLKITEDQFEISFGSASELAERATSSSSLHVLVFGADRESGWSEVGEGRRILFTYSLDRLTSDPTLKKELWRHLQAILR